MEFPVDIRKIDFAHKEIIEKIRSEHGHILSSHAFASLYLWQYAMGLSLTCGKEFFAVQCDGDASNTWFFPCGDEREIHRFIAERMSDKPFSLRYLRSLNGAYIFCNHEENLGIEGIRQMKSSLCPIEKTHVWEADLK